MEKRFSYKGYSTSIHYSAEDKVYHGRLDGISDLVNFEGATQADAVLEFRLAVDDYLEYCLEIGKEPLACHAGRDYTTAGLRH